TRQAPREKSMTPKIVLIAGIVLCLLAAVLLAAGILGKSDESSGTRGLVDQKIKEVQTKEEQINAVEAELDKARLETADLTKEAVALKARLEESQKELATAEQRLGSARRELERLSTRRAQVETRNDPRRVERVTAPARPTQRSVDPGVYETLRATEVHEQPAQSSRVISRIPGGTRVNVVRSDGEWLEVISKRGNPPGYILRESAKIAAGSN
ncbi:MAG: SH3 domain-containing protein, partial [Candidatus Binatia bacterium]